MYETIPIGLVLGGRIKAEMKEETYQTIPIGLVPGGRKKAEMKEETYQTIPVEHCKLTISIGR